MIAWRELEIAARYVVQSYDQTPPKMMRAVIGELRLGAAEKKALHDLWAPRGKVVHYGSKYKKADAEKVLAAVSKFISVNAPELL